MAAENCDDGDVLDKTKEENPSSTLAMDAMASSERKRKCPENEEDCAETKRQRKNDVTEEEVKIDPIEDLFDGVMMLYSKCKARWSKKKEIYYAFVSISVHYGIENHMRKEMSFCDIDGKHSEYEAEIEVTDDSEDMLEIMFDRNSKCLSWRSFYDQQSDDFYDEEDSGDYYYDSEVRVGEDGEIVFSESIESKMRDVVKRMLYANILMETQETLYIGGNRIRTSDKTSRSFKAGAYVLM